MLHKQLQSSFSQRQKIPTLLTANRLFLLPQRSQRSQERAFLLQIAAALPKACFPLLKIIWSLAIGGGFTTTRMNSFSFQNANEFALVQIVFLQRTERLHRSFSSRLRAELVGLGLPEQGCELKRTRSRSSLRS